MKRTVVIVNGRPRSGKSTFARVCMNYLCDTDICDSNYISSITPVKDAAKILGWTDIKDNKSRKFLSDMKKLWVEYNNGALLYTTRMIINDTTNMVTFIDIRELSEIKKFINALDMFNISCVTVMVSSDKTCGKDVGNESDDNVNMDCNGTFKYNYGIHYDMDMADKFRDDSVDVMNKILWRNGDETEKAEYRCRITGAGAKV